VTLSTARYCVITVNPPFSANVVLIQTNRLSAISRKYTTNMYHYFSKLVLHVQGYPK
jgi:hypothetical protein